MRADGRQISFDCVRKIADASGQEHDLRPAADMLCGSVRSMHNSVRLAEVEKAPRAAGVAQDLACKG